MPCPAPFYQILLWNTTSYGMGQPFGHLGQLSSLCLCPGSCSQPAYRSLREQLKERFDTLGTLLSNSQNTDVLSPLCQLQTQSTALRAAVGRVNSSPDRPSTAPQRSQAEQGLQVPLHWAGLGKSVCSSDLTQRPFLSRLWEVLVPCCDIKDGDWCELCLGFRRNVPWRQPWTIFPGCVENFSILQRVLRSALRLQCVTYHRIFVSAWAER